MPRKVRWTYTMARATVAGCDLQVSATAGSTDTCTWIVTSGGQHVDNGAAATMEAAQEAAETAARRHAEREDERSRQLLLF